VDCRSCGRALEPGTRFCPACGTPTERACAACGATLPADGRFCPSCGTAAPEIDSQATATSAAPTGPSAQTGAAPESGRERKVATMVFADLVGFTSLNESADPELVQALVTRAFDRLSTEVTRYEGLVEKFAGDAMLAVFGVPAIHEDDAERAVRAALEMQAAMVELAADLRREGHPELSLRIGVETGEVLVDLGRASGERDRIVTGDAVNTAARLQQVATPGAIVVGPSSYAATRDVVDYDELPAAVLKGKALPVAAWRAVAVKARRGGVRPSLGIEAPLIGRDEEIALLKETVRRTVSERRPHLVTVVGSAGVGKSRLTWELEKYLDGLPDVFYWRKGRCLAYAQASYSALADAVKADAKILDDDAPATAQAKLDARVVELGCADDASIAPALAALLAMGANDGLGRDALYDAWRRYLEALAADSPLVLVQEDIHWADDGLLDFLEYLARWAEGPILVLCLARHELLERRAAWGGGIPNAASIVLEPLDTAESAQLVDGLLAGGLPPELRDRVVTLADGNPLFTEELVRMFVDRGVVRFVDDMWQLARPVEEVEIPGSIQAVLAARLDGLPAAEKRAAQNASVVGRIFWDALIAHLARQGTSDTGEVLRRLRVKELVVPRSPSALAGAAEFGFRHVLIRDVAYDSLPKRDRAAKHLDVARWAEETMADRQDEMVELLAAHYLAALRYEEEFAASDSERLRDLRAKTYAYARRAAARAAGVANKESAARWYGVAIEQARALDLPAIERAALAMDYSAAASGYEPHETIRRIDEEALLLVSGDGAASPERGRLEARIRVDLAFFRYVATDLAGARAVLLDGLVALEGGPPCWERAALRARLGWTYWRGGPLDQAPAILRLAIKDAQACGADDVERMAIHDLAVTQGMLGDPQESVELIKRSMELARAADDRVLLGRCYINVPAIMLGNGELAADILPIMAEGLERARRSLDHTTISWIVQNRADVLTVVGRLPEALADAEEALAEARLIGEPGRIQGCLGERAWVRFHAGDVDAAAADVAESRTVQGQAEPQAIIYEALMDALLEWPMDPSTAARRIPIAAGSPDIAPASLLDAAPVGIRMALRADESAMRPLIESFQRVAEGTSGPITQLQRRWFGALLEAPDVALAEILEVATGFEAIDYPLQAANAWADAALLAQRIGRSEEAGVLAANAQALYAACSAMPLLGDDPPGVAPAGLVTVDAAAAGTTA
jgi:class 3 adenylate cyclase